MAPKKKKKVPSGFHRMPNGKMMSQEEMDKAHKLPMKKKPKAKKKVYKR
jgi:hypothetical protein